MFIQSYNLVPLSTAKAQKYSLAVFEVITLIGYPLNSLDNTT